MSNDLDALTREELIVRLSGSDPSQLKPEQKAKFALIADKLIDLAKRDKIDFAQELGGKSGPVQKDSELGKFADRLTTLLGANPNKKSLTSVFQSRGVESIERELDRLDVVYEHKGTKVKDLTAEAQAKILDCCKDSLVGRYSQITKDAFVKVLNSAYREEHGKGNCLEAHHIPPSQSLLMIGLNSDKGIACLMFSKSHAETLSHGNNGYRGAIHRVEQAQRIVTWNSLEKAALRDIHDIFDILKSEAIPKELHRTYHRAMEKLYNDNLVSEKQAELKSVLASNLAEVKVGLSWEKLVLKAKDAQKVEETLQDEFQRLLRKFDRLEKACTKLQQQGKFDEFRRVDHLLRGVGGVLDGMSEELKELRVDSERTFSQLDRFEKRYGSRLDGVNTQEIRDKLEQKAEELSQRYQHQQSRDWSLTY